ncbi:MAG: R2-like ligand-binding oxidase [Planctomycetota bacterium]
MIQRTGYQTTSARGLEVNHPAMRLFQKAKRLGTWDPCAVDLRKDREDWLKLSATEQDVLLNLTSLFQAGEEAVTLDLLPLVQAVAEEHRIEEEIYLTSFLWEEAKHVETFHRFLDEVAGVERDLTEYHLPSYRRIFYEELPRSLGRLRVERTPEALADAAVTYNLVVEGILAETGYHGYYWMLKGANIMPGMQELISLTKRDESRHIAFGIYLLSRLVAEHGDPIWKVIDARINELLAPSVAIIGEGLAKYDVLPFDLRAEMFVEYAMSQFQSRYSRIEKARRQSLDCIMRVVDFDESLE